MRKIDQRMISYLDEKLRQNGLAQHSIATKNPRQLFIEAASACVGIREATGNNDGPLVELLQKTVDGRAENEPYCMGFIQTMIAYAEVKIGIKSLIVASEHCMTTWRDTPAVCRVKMHPLPGAVPIWQHRGTASGHTGICLGADEWQFTAIEANTTSGADAAGKIVREGGGIYFTTRLIRPAGDMQLIGFLKPFDAVVV